MEKKQTKILALVGKKRSGKDTVAEYLINHYKFQRYSFADPIKRAAMHMFGFTEAQMWGSTEDKENIDPRWNISPRRMLQIIGTDLFQYDIQKHLKEGEFPFGRSVWVNRFKIWYREEMENPYDIVIADMRFHHEAEAIRELNGEIWRVVRPSLVSDDEHPSEREQETIAADKTIVNDGSLHDLYDKIQKII